MATIKELWRRFRRWQREPVVAAPLRDEQHVCLNCGDSFDGNYCPRCGQSGATSRFTVKGALMHMMDVWGLGSNGMARMIVHLLGRPGYMIRDYLRGKRQCYFSPFKILFVLATALIIISAVLPGEQTGRYTSAMEDIKQGMTGTQDTDNEQFNKEMAWVAEKMNIFGDWQNRNKALSSILSCLLTTAITALVFRRPPALPGVTLVEHFYVNILIAGQLLFLSIVNVLVVYAATRTVDYTLPGQLTSLIYVLDYRQTYGYSWWGTLWRSLMVLLLMMLVVMVVLMAVTFAVGVHSVLATH